MPLFECTECKVLDSTGWSTYWVDVKEGLEPKCTQCKTGTWHGKFARMTAVERDFIDNGKGFFHPKDGWDNYQKYNTRPAFF